MSNTRITTTFLALATMLLALLRPAPAIAQQPDGGGSAITGTVASETTGELIVGATVVVSPTGQGAITDERGQFRIEVPPGTYSVEVSAIGYASQTREVEVGEQPAELTVTMADDPRFAETIVVVGSRTPRSVAKSPVPIDVITAEQIQEVGEVETNQILKTVAPSYNASHQTISDGTDHVNPASLRGLGPDQVLVLVNGKRRHSSALTNVNGTFGRGTVGIDLNAIPTTAIKRIEVLRDGAAAQYGSDAIAGVINVELRDSVGVADVTALTGITGSGDGFQLKTGLNYGVALGDSGVLSVTGEFVQRNPTNRAGEWTGDFYPGIEGEAATDAALAANGLTRDDIKMRIGQSQATVGMLFYNARIPMDYAEAYSFGGLTYRDGEAAGFYRRPNQLDRFVPEVYPNGFLPEIHTGIMDWSAGGGIRTQNDHEGLQWDFSINHGGNSFDYRVENSINASLGVLSPTEFDAGGFTYTQTTLNADLVKTIPTDALERLSLAAGLGYRIENYRIRAGETASFVAGPELQPDGVTPMAAGAQVFPGFQPSNEVDEYRNSVAAYLGAETELTDKILVDVAGRFENFDDFGSTVNGKLAGRVQAIEKLAVRAAVSTGFRAPSLQQVFFNSTSTQFVGDPLEPRQVLTSNNVSDVTRAFGIPPLEEETSLNVSGGVTVTPLANLSVTADAYFITIDNRIVLTNQFSEGAVAGVGDLLDPFGVQAAQFFANAVDTQTRGVDLVVEYSTDLSGGTMRVTGAANFTSTTVEAVNIPQGVADVFGGGDLDAVREVFFNREEANRLEDALPRQKGLLQGRYARGPYTALLRANYYGPVTFKSASGPDLDEEFGAQVVFDLDLGYAFENGLKVAVGANNLLNTFPDKQQNPNNVFNNQFIYSRRVSQFGINGGFYYLRLQYLY